MPDHPTLQLNGVRPGDPCWVVPHDGDHPGEPSPLFVQSAVLAREGDGVRLVHEGRIYGVLDVFRTEAEAWNRAYSRAAGDLAFHERELAATRSRVAYLDAHRPQGEPR